MFRKILVPTDFSDEADRVLKYAMGLQKFGLKEVTLVHVIDTDKSYFWPPSSKSYKAIKSRLEERERILQEKGLKVKGLLLEGNPSGEILELAYKEDFSLIVTGSHGKRLLEELLIGSVSETISREARVPVLLIRYDVLKDIEREQSLEEYAASTFRKILYPSDFSPCSAEALSYIKKLKRAGAKDVVAVHIVDNKRLETEQEKEELVAACRIECNEIAAELKKSGLKTKSICRIGDPLREILDVADEEDVSLIVMGSHGKSIIKEWLVGSVSLNVIRVADRPALVVHES